MAELTRRLLLKLTGVGGASALAAGLGVKNAQRLIPLMIPPTEPFRPGQWMHYATTCRECPAGCGMHVRCIDGRAQKCEGNPAHEINHGALCPRGQSAVQGLYDPDRLKHAYHRVNGVATPVDLPTAIQEIAKLLVAGKPDRKLAIISRLEPGILGELIRSFACTFAGAALFYEPFAYEALQRAHEAVFGQRVIPRYHLDRASFILSFGVDFLESWISPVEFAHDFATQHCTPLARDARFVYIGPRLSMAAGNADTFHKLPPREMLILAVSILKKMLDLGLAKLDISAVLPALDKFLSGTKPPLEDAAVATLAKQFVEADGSVALAGPTGMDDGLTYHTAVVAALMNYAAGRIGQTVDFNQTHALSYATPNKEINQYLDGLTPQSVLFVNDTNIAYSHHNGQRIRTAGTIIYLGQMDDETAQLADWVVPIHSPLEAWGDCRPWTGVQCLQQPVMRSLHESAHAGDVLLGIGEAADAPIHRLRIHTYDEFLEHSWQQTQKSVSPDADFKMFWTESLRRGFVVEKEPGAQPMPAKFQAEGLAKWQPFLPPVASSGSVDLWLWPSTMLFDGRVSNRGWLQEAPDPMSTIVWGSYLDIHPAHAARLGVAEGQVVKLTAPAGGSVEVAVRFTDDIVDGVVGTFFGQGHTAMGRNAAGVGCNAFALARSPEGTPLRVTIEKLPRSETFVNLSASQHQFGRAIVQWTDLANLGPSDEPGEEERFDLPLPEGYSPDKDMYAGPKYTKNRWGMVIDLERCIGCGACAVACYAENNIGVAGRQHCAQGREKAWLKVTPYRKQDDPRQVGWLVLPCQQCDSAPCEPVCPVFASVHNEEGINAQVYNRCIGTRYCNNNCPYKVRRFNWFNDEWPKPLDWQLNPQVSVRGRGVMEKCTFCIQRIRQAQLNAKRHGTEVKDGEIVPACAQTCPTRAILFGNLLDPASEVGRVTRNDPRRYHLLANLNTKPAIAYLRRIDKESTP